MQPIPVNFLGILRLLSNSGARFVVIGGVALLLHGGDNFTLDMDVSFARDRENTDALARALAPYHPRLRGIPADLPFVFDGQTLRNAATLTLETDLGDFDLLAEPSGVDSFSGLYDRATIVNLEDMDVRIASLPDLLAMKRSANRPKDVGHIHMIESLMKLQ